VSQTYTKERNDKYVGAALFLGLSAIMALVAVNIIRDLPAGEQHGAWIIAGLSAVGAGIPTAAGLWRMTPWPELPEDQKGTGLPMKYAIVFGFAAPVGGYLIETSHLALRVFFAMATGFYFACGLIFLFVGVFKQWISKDPTFRRL
jgi:hypothetical protein